MAFNPNVSYGIQGQLVQWTRVIRNTGSSTSNSVRMTLNIPSIFGYNSHSVTKGSYNSTSKTWTVGSLASNEQATISIYFLTNTAPDGDLSLISTLTGTGTDTDLGNNEATDIWEYAPIETPSLGFQVNEETAYISNFRNLDNSIGTPVLGDLSRVYNPNTSGFNWATLNAGLFSNMYFFKGTYSGTIPFTNKRVEAGFSDFTTLTIDNSKVIDINDVLNTLTIKNKSIVTANKNTGKVVFSGTGGILNIDNLGGTVEMSGACTGIFNINANNVSNAVTFKASTTTAPSYSTPTTINLTIKNLDNLFIVNNIDLSGLNLNINIESTTERGKLRFDGITVNDDTNITVTGNFYDDANTDFFVYPQIEIKNTTNVGDNANRINIVNSTFYLISSNGIVIYEDSLGVNINGCQLKTRGSAAISTVNTEVFLANSITNDTYGYGTDPNFLGSIIQDPAY